MNKEHHVIYIPGLGDRHAFGQDKLIQIWRMFGMTPHYLQMSWASPEPYEKKLQRLLEELDSLTRQGFLVSLIGISAGASMAMNAYTLRKEKTHRTVFVCGKLLYPETIQAIYFKENPAFKKSVFEADANFKKLTDSDKSRLLTMYALADNTVPVKASKLPGVEHKRILALGHIPAIFTAITFYSYAIAKFIKSSHASE